MDKPRTSRLTVAWVTSFLAAAAWASANDFPLKFHAISADKVMSYPTAGGTYGMIQPTKPDGIKSEPKAVSKHPLYGVFNPAERASRAGGVSGLRFRLDESKGDGKGYDQLIIDLNHNGNLTDDPVAMRITPLTNTAAGSMQQVLFGPIELPADKAVAGGRPVYFAQAYIYNLQNSLTGITAPQTSIAGQLMIRTGWYVDTTVEMDGVKMQVAIMDTGGNMRLGGVWEPEFYSNSGGSGNDSWNFSAGDYFLTDPTGEGDYCNDRLARNRAPFGPVLYLGTTPYKASLSKDCASLTVEPMAEPLAEITVQPQGDQVTRLILARESRPDKWELMAAPVVGGKAKVPAGSYRLYSCLVGGRTPNGEPLLAYAYERQIKTPSVYKAGQTNLLKCGGPLNVEVTAAKAKASAGTMAWLKDPAPAVSDSDYVLSINANVTGQGGEGYSSYGVGKDYTKTPDRPTFTIADSKGVRGSGNLEYG